MSLFPKVLVLATSRRSHGGISSVVMAHERTDEWRNHRCSWIATHRSGSKLTKLAYLLSGFLRYIVLLPGSKAVHMHIGHAPSAKRKLLFMGMAKTFGKKTIVHIHADLKPTILGSDKDVYFKLFREADRIVVLSKKWRDEIIRMCPTVHPPEILYNPCPATAASTAGQRDKERPYILSAGVLDKNKGYHDLIRAFAKVADRHPDWRLVFAGSGEIENGKAIAGQLGISDRVEFPGWVSGTDKDRLFRQASVLCLPSYAEGFPMAVLDAWAYGLPVVATPVGSLPDFVHDGDDILLFNPGDTDALARQLDRIMGDEALREKLSATSRIFAEDTLSQQTIGRQLGKIYDGLLSANR